MGLFDKKTCDICGAKIGLLGNRKLEGGNICKDCAGKLSPWFTGRKHSELAAIKEQLAAREENRAAVASFNATKTFGKGSQALYVDEAKGNFAVCYASDFEKGNPDIIPLSCVRDCVAYRQEHKNELKYKDKEGKMVSYIPPRYEYSYDFQCELTVDHPYIDEIKFRLNSMTLKPQQNRLLDTTDRDMRMYTYMCDEIHDYLLRRDTATAPERSFTAPAAPSPMHEEPKNWVCPCCNGVNSGKFCEYCGSPKP